MRYVADRRGVSALEALDHGGPGEAIVAADGVYSYGEAAFRARLLALCLRSRGLGRDWIAVWRGGRRREWLPVMAAVGAAGGVWCEGDQDTVPERTRVVFSGVGSTSDAEALPPMALCVRLDPAAPGSVDLDDLIAEGRVLVGLTGLRRNWKLLWRVDGASITRWGPGAFVSVGAPGPLGRHLVGDLQADFAAASLAHAHLLYGATLVFEGEADPPRLRTYGTPRTGLATYAGADDMARHPGSVGRAFADTDLWIVGEHGTLLGPSEVGDVWVGHPHVVAMEGVPAGVASTGDRGALDEDGFLHLE